MVEGYPVRRFEVHLFSFDSTKGSEIRKIRPCLMISPMTSTIKNYPKRVTTTFQGSKGQILLDHSSMRTVGKSRLIKNLGIIISSAGEKALNTMQEMFAP